MSGESFGLERISWAKLSGLRPKAWLCVGSGYSREECKAFALEQGSGLTGRAILDLSDLCLLLAGSRAEGAGLRVLSPSARQEILGELLSEPRIRSFLPELRQLRRKRDFLKRLDFSIQSGRMTFAHAEEERVYSEKLEARFGRSPVRDEIRKLAQAYEAWISEKGFADLPYLLALATETLARGWPEGAERLEKPDEIYHLSGQFVESREALFWEALAREAPVIKIGGARTTEPAPEIAWELWHTADDAAESLAERVAPGGGESALEEQAVLFADLPFVRRSMRRALDFRGIPIADPQDPTRIRWDEAIKEALLPLSLAARGFERSDVDSYLRRGISGISRSELALFDQEIFQRGIQRGLSAYAGGALAPLHERLSRIARGFGGKGTCSELARAHAGWLSAQYGEDTSRAWVVDFFESVWGDLVSDLELVERASRRASPLFWLSKLESRIADRKDAIDRLKPRRGLRAYRLQQWPFSPGKTLETVWILGSPSGWLSEAQAGDDWFNEKERESLSAEFLVRSGIQIQEERKEALRAWLSGARKAIFLDFEYSSDGRERESIAPLLRELGFAGARAAEMGAHGKWLSSFGVPRGVQPQSASLGPAAQSTVTATALDRYSRCGLQSLALDRWRLKEPREPDSEMPADSRGNILHEAVRLLLESRAADGSFAMSAESALEQAWKTKRPKGLLRGERVAAHSRRKMLVNLHAFLEKERDYFDRARPKTLHLENLELKLEYPELTIVGKPDRVDEGDSGLLVMDYKTSSGLPSGTEMLESGYRLQLPFYGVALLRSTAHSGKPVTGAQFVELSRKAGRGSGVFFKRFNGKEKGSWTNLRSNSKSLLGCEPEEAWERFEESILAHARAYVAGQFEAKPKKPVECQKCPASDLCGRRRLGEAE